MRDWRQKNPERSREATRRWRKNNPEKVKAGDTAWYAANKEKKQAYGRKQRASYRTRFPEKVVDSKLRSMYGVTLEQYNRMLKKQKNRCAICHCKETALRRGGKVRRLSIDHCHDTGIVRGLLCSRCNTAIGLFRHKDAIIKAAAEYVTKPPFRLQGKP